jgi:hypothetical protein
VIQILNRKQKFIKKIQKEEKKLYKEFVLLE